MMRTIRCRLWVGVAAVSAVPMIFAAGANDAAVSATELLHSVPPLEMFARAAKSVMQAPVAQRQSVAVEMVKAACRLNETAGPLMVAHLGRILPETVPAITAAAASVTPDLTETIVKAALKVAPGQGPAIVQSLCRQNPQSFDVVAIAAASGMRQDKAAEVVLETVSSVLPATKPALDRARADMLSRNGKLSVEAAVTYAKQVSFEQELKANQLAGATRLQRSETKAGVAEAVGGRNALSEVSLRAEQPVGTYSISSVVPVSQLQGPVVSVNPDRWPQTGSPTTLKPSQTFPVTTTRLLNYSCP